MCGIFAYVGERKNSATLVLNGLRKLEYRGYDSWGVAVVDFESPEKRILIKKDVGKIGNADVSELPNSDLVIGHTRWATHGGVTKANAHPHTDCADSIAVVHNGIFENYEQVKKKLVRSGHGFESETDTEVVAHLIEEYMKKDEFVAATRKAFMQMKGLNALVVINKSERKIIAIRNGSPLVLGFGGGENFIASDPIALLEHTKDVYFLENNEMALVDKDNVWVYENVSSQNLKEVKTQKIDWNVIQTGKGEYKYFMEKEIYEQPAIMASIAARPENGLKNITSKLKNADDVVLVGCGTAYYACLLGYYLFSKIAGKRVFPVVGSEFSYLSKQLNKKSVVVALSQSGETMDVLGPLKSVSDLGVEIIAIVNAPHSSLYRMADENILIGAGPERAVASTKAFTGKLAHLGMLAYTSVDKYKEGKNVLNKAVFSSNKVLSDESVSKIKVLAKKLRSADDLYILGRGISYPISLETALKIKEISYIHAEGLAAGELKHGTLALIEPGKVCIVFLPNDETYEDSLSGAMEIKARGGYVVGVSFKNHSSFDYYINIEDAEEMTIIPNVIFAQMLAYEIALERGLDPDMPRNLAKSVTVK